MRLCLRVDGRHTTLWSMKRKLGLQNSVPLVPPEVYENTRNMRRRGVSLACLCMARVSLCSRDRLAGAALGLSTREACPLRPFRKPSAGPHQELSGSTFAGGSSGSEPCPNDDPYAGPRLGAETLLYKNRWERRGSVELLAQALLVGGVEQGREQEDNQRDGR